MATGCIHKFHMSCFLTFVCEKIHLTYLQHGSRYKIERAERETIKKMLMMMVIMLMMEMVMMMTMMMVMMMTDG